MIEVIYSCAKLEIGKIYDQDKFPKIGGKVYFNQNDIRYFTFKLMVLGESSKQEYLESHPQYIGFIPNEFYYKVSLD